MPKKKMSASQLAARTLGKMGGLTTKAKYGKAHFQALANKRWHPEAEKKQK